MNAILNNLPSAIYVPVLVTVIIVIFILLIINRKAYPKAYITAFCFMIISGILLIILKLEWLNNIRQVVVLLTFLFLIAGLLTIFISGYKYNKRNGVKIDKTLKKIIIYSLLVAVIGVVLFAFCLYMKSR